MRLVSGLFLARRLRFPNIRVKRGEHVSDANTTKQDSQCCHLPFCGTAERFVGVVHITVVDLINLFMVRRGSER